MDVAAARREVLEQERGRAFGVKAVQLLTPGILVIFLRRPLGTATLELAL